MLNVALHEAQNVHGPVKTLAVTMATQNARAHALFFVQHGFTRTADRSRNTWTYISDVEEQKLRKQCQSRAKKAKPEPKPEPTHLERLEQIHDQYLKDGLKQVPQKLLDKIQAEKELQETTARIEKERARVKRSPEYLEIQAAIQKLKDRRAGMFPIDC
jgi:hypothetical protein